jgi:Nif-specific regulatory protein
LTRTAEWHIFTVVPMMLVIDDDETVRDLFVSFFGENGYGVAAASEAKSGLEIIMQEKIDLLFLDLVMPGMRGIDLLKELAAVKMRIPTIVMTAVAEVETAVEAMRLGAFDYITKPFILDELLLLAERALKMHTLQKENAMLQKQLKKKYDLQGLIGSSSQMLKVCKLIEKIADTESTVLIYGESGTGKEVVANTIHYNSSRSQSPFVPINCAAIPKDLLESELFGHEKGAFTGAVNMRMGCFELAAGGTIFLDEIGELHPSLQAKLLRVLQERSLERVGGTKTVKVDVRILAATNKDLEKATREGTFREDLFYRLNVIPLHIPPLRKRKEDIPLLFEHFMNSYARKKKKEPLRVSPEAMEAIMHYRWPGNVRELENLVERIVILDDDGIVTGEDLPERFSSCAPAAEHPAVSPVGHASDISLPESGVDINSILDDVERSLIVQAMQKAGGVKKKAAELLGLNRTTLLEKLKKKGIEWKTPDKTQS